jgi:hypothetical protein
MAHTEGTARSPRPSARQEGRLCGDEEFRNPGRTAAFVRDHRPFFWPRKAWRALGPPSVSVHHVGPSSSDYERGHSLTRRTVRFLTTYVDLRKEAATIAWVFTTLPHTPSERRPAMYDSVCSIASSSLRPAPG